LADPAATDVEPDPSGPDLREEEVESRWEAAPAVLLVIAMQAVLAVISRRADWHLWKLPWWIWLIAIVPEVLLLIPLATDSGRTQLEEMGLRRKVALTLLSVISVVNGLGLLALIASLVTGHETSGAQLLTKAAVVWATNVVTFGLWYWAFDRGGPVRRLEPNPRPPDFQFPQMENPELAAPGWRPQLVDYMYISFTNSIAFSPTDAMPLSRPAKALMLLEASASAVTILLAAARAVNILR
jgi:hypothetical protein